MDFADTYEEKTPYLKDTIQKAVKLSVVGSFGVGKTTFIKSLSEIKPFTTEETITQTSEGIDRLDSSSDKRTTTVALDFGRLTLSDRIVLYLFGTPGQDRFDPMWKAAMTGSIGTLVLVDTRYLEESFDILERVENYYGSQGKKSSYAVAVNQFDGTMVYPEMEVREALALQSGTPLISCDARDRASCFRASVKLVEHCYHLITENK